MTTTKEAKTMTIYETRRHARRVRNVRRIGYNMSRIERREFVRAIESDPILARHPLSWFRRDRSWFAAFGDERQPLVASSGLSGIEVREVSLGRLGIVSEGSIIFPNADTPRHSPTIGMENDR